ncbi:MAG TPA: SCP2 sterol-binding domain-containing protein [Actinomycetota bacterium]|nr:SCP2 sterol-binding domain-containing protein [Actinomycetota bacterium]
MATKHEVEAKLRVLIERLDGAGDGVAETLADALPEAKVVGLHVTDLDAHWWTEMSDGRFSALAPGQPDGADIRIAMTSDDLVDLVDGRANLFSKVVAGHVRVDASLSDLLRLRRLAG